MRSFLKIPTFLKMGIAVLALFPGIALYLQLVQVPPDFVGIAHIVSFSVSVLVVISIPLFTSTISSIRRPILGIAAIIAVILGAGVLVSYTYFARDHIVDDRGRPVVDSQGRVTGVEKRITPFRPSQKILNMIAPMQGRTMREGYELALESLPENEANLLRTSIADESWGSFAAMVLLLILSQVLLVAPPIIVAWRLANEGDKTTAPGRQGNAQS